MTRANFIIVTKNGKFKLQANSSAYPSNIFEHLIAFAVSTATKNSAVAKEGEIGFYDSPDSWDLAKLIEGVGLTFGHVGNPTYFYTVDFVKQTLTAWGTTTRWINAPLDWEAKGWRGVYKGKNGRMGYQDCNIKGKKIYDKSFKDLVFTVNDKQEVVLNSNVLSEFANIS